jgi:hypothetical protein
MAEPKTTLESGESVLKEGRANLQRGAETAGGRLFLTNRRLIFESHIFNVQRGGDQIQLSQISEMRPAWTKFFGVLPLMPSTLSVRTSGGAEHNLVCRSRGSWMEAIQDAQTDGEQRRD